MSYEEIVIMVRRGCGKIFNGIPQELVGTILQCATQIYIKQMELENGGKE